MDPTLSPRRSSADIALCLVFFTRLPLPVFGLPQVALRQRDLGRACSPAAIVGVCGGAAYAAGHLAFAAAIVPRLAALGVDLASHRQPA